MADISEFTQKSFQDSSKAWKSNKTRYGQAMYNYKKNAFQKDLEEPVEPKPSKRNEKECLKRQQTDEGAGQWSQDANCTNRQPSERETGGID